MLGCIPVESAEVPRMLKDIANDIYLDGKSDEFETVSLNEGMEWLEKNCVNAARLVSEFLQKHGHRSLKEVNVFNAIHLNYVESIDFLNDFGRHLLLTCQTTQPLLFAVT